MAIGVSGQAGPKPQKKFLSAPLLIEDQGSFFIGGVPKVTDYATFLPPPRRLRVAPNAAPAPPPATPAPHQITIGQMYVQYQVPAQKGRHRVARHHGARIESHGGVSRVDA